jgi:CHAT domain-containing protein
LLEHGRRDRLVQQPPVRATESRAPALDTAALHARLDRNTALVAYAELDGELFALSVAGGRLRLHRHLARWSEVLAALRALRGQLATQQLGGTRLQRHSAQLAERTRRCLARLHLLVWQQLAGALQDAQAVLVVPCGALAGLPFAALWDGSGYLVERRDLALAASVETALGRRVPASGGTLTPNACVVAIADTARLPGAAAEVAALRACWPGARAHTGERATRAAQQAEAAGADQLHLACHGEFRADSPLFSALHLHDGALTALDAERLPLAARLVVLSGCETALSDAARDDEALGLVRAFLIGGAGRVLGGLWAVDDAATARWMAAFHARLAAGASPPQALGEVQRGFIAAGEHPYVWAAFVMHGQG